MSETTIHTMQELETLAKARVKQGVVSERELQGLLNLTPSRVRKLTDMLVESGFAFRCDRMLVLNEVVLTCEPDHALVAPLLAALERGPNTSLQLTRQMRAELEVVRATLEMLRAQQVLTASTHGALTIYRRAWKETRSA